MTLYYLFAAAILIAQAVILVEAFRHVVYTSRTYRPKATGFFPPVALIAPCKGFDTAFDRNINSFFDLDYPHYEIFFVVESTADPACARLRHIIDERRATGRCRAAHLLVAGVAVTCAQKLHNLLHAYHQLPDHLVALAFVDSDACLKPHFLAQLVNPLRRHDVGAATGYRWFVPADRRLSTLVLSAANAFFASCLGPHRWNSAWGGAMAIRRDLFQRLEIPSIWQHACTDDYTLTWLVKKAGLSILFVPACFVASYEALSWSELFRFARRQFIITRVYRPWLWLTALLGLGHFTAGFWVGLGVSLYLFLVHSPHAPHAVILPAVLYALAFLKALGRQVLIRRILPEDRAQLLFPALLDLLAQPLLAPFSLAAVLAAAAARTITWRGIRYILHGPARTEIQPLNGAP